MGFHNCIIDDDWNVEFEREQQQSGMHCFFTNPFLFFIFLICAFAETNRTPFDLAECRVN
jgi:NADH:ubiquinone oxidoreductase subunit H